MAKIILHGILDVFGEPLDISANTANDALIAIITHLKRTNQELFKDQLFLQVKGYDTLEALKAPLNPMPNYILCLLLTPVRREDCS